MAETDLSSFNNSWYKPGNKVKIILWYYTNILFFKSAIIPSSSLKRALLRLFGAQIGHGVIIKPCVNIKYPWKLKIGDFTWIGENVWIDNLDMVDIGANVCLSQGALLICGNHNYKKSTFDLTIKTITIEKGAWIGARSTVTGGVKIGSHAVLSIGSMTSKDLDGYQIYFGNPAKAIRERVIV